MKRNNDRSGSEIAYILPGAHGFHGGSGNATKRIPRGERITPDAVERRWQALATSAEASAALLENQGTEYMQEYERNIENYIGTVKLPVGVVGPLRVNGLFAQGDYHIPLATTEATLVASYSRGAKLVTEAGGCTAMLLNEGVSRAPGFAFRNLREVREFVIWVTSQRTILEQTGASTTRHGKMTELRATIEGNHVYLNFEFATGDACGQNMVTIATEAICEHIAKHSPVQPQYFFLEANHSGDKKASAQSFLGVRGKRVTAEVTVPTELLQTRLHTNPERMVDYWRMAALGGVLSGTIGTQGHYANGLAALYIACGQDAACVAESAVGITRLELAPNNALYAAVTLPNIMVGTVGGGTHLPSQRACLEILGLAGPGKCQAFAEVCGALMLAGELSIIAALCSGDFARAHQHLARGTNMTLVRCDD